MKAKSSKNFTNAENMVKVAHAEFVKKVKEFEGLDAAAKLMERIKNAAVAENKCKILLKEDVVKQLIKKYGKNLLLKILRHFNYRANYGGDEVLVIYWSEYDPQNTDSYE